MSANFYFALNSFLKIPIIFYGRRKQQLIRIYWSQTLSIMTIVLRMFFADMVSIFVAAENGH